MRADRYQRIIETLSRRQPDLSIAMENVHKSRNLGALARTCDAVGIGAIHAIAPSGSPLNLGHKTAGGVEKWITVERHPDVESAYAHFRRAGFTILAADVGPGAIDYLEVDYRGPTIIVMGSELDGLSASAAKHADQRVMVPIRGMVESLNVSVASGIILFEAARQRELAGCYARRRISDDEFERKCFEWLHPTVAAYCRTHKRDYPSLDEAGEIREAITQNRRDGFAALDSLSRSN